MTLLTDQQVEKELEHINVAWTVVDTVSLQRVFTFPDFNTALEFVNKVGGIAEKIQHHPDIQLSWGKVVIILTTHDAQGLTKKDFTVASAIEKLL